MFKKEGIPFFSIMIPFISIIFSAFFTLSYYLKVSEEQLNQDILSYVKIHGKDSPNIDKFIVENKKIYKNSKEKFTSFIIIITSVILFSLGFFIFLMSSYMNTIVEKYLQKVEAKEEKLKDINKTLAIKVKEAIKETELKNRLLLQQSKLAMLGSMISMIAHQWRQPLSEISGLLMELELATKMKKADEKHILNSIKKSNKVLDFMSNTIEDFRDFYRPDKTKEIFLVSDACKRALDIASATLENLGIALDLHVKNDLHVEGYPREYSQVILSIITNAKEIIVSRKIKNPKIKIIVNSNKQTSIVTIEDNAKGVKKENMDFIFDPYFSTKEYSKGTGLGLYISKVIIEKNMHGRLSVYNSKNGAVFKIEIG
jgi:C4-dicarboxylate-specific signal transduction histidine kinase